MSDRVYLDWNASAPLRPEARAAMIAAMDVAGNPSSVHTEGRAARAVVERARAQVAALVGCAPAEVVFTSGATEAAGVLSAAAPRSVTIADQAHDALWVHRLPGGAGGAKPELRAGPLACGETGVVHRIAAGGAGPMLLDVSQAAGRVPFGFAEAGADMAILSGHKIGGPTGTGALILREGCTMPPLVRGGGQELGRRSGTENVAGLAGFGAAAAAAHRDLICGAWGPVAEARDALEATLRAAAPDLIVIGDGGPRLPNTSCFALPGWKGETQVMAMDLAGFAISAGSACSSGKVKESRVLRAMGFDAVTASSAVRVSFGPTTAAEDIRQFAETWIGHYRRWKARAA